MTNIRHTRFDGTVSLSETVPFDDFRARFKYGLAANLLMLFISSALIIESYDGGGGTTRILVLDGACAKARGRFSLSIRSFVYTYLIYSLYNIFVLMANEDKLDRVECNPRWKQTLKQCRQSVIVRVR